jgi:hypothetical protein
MILDLVLPFKKSLDVIQNLKQWEGGQSPEVAVAIGVTWRPVAGDRVICLVCSTMVR